MNKHHVEHVYTLTLQVISYNKLLVACPCLFANRSEQAYSVCLVSNCFMCHNKGNPLPYPCLGLQ